MSTNELTATPALTFNQRIHLLFEHAIFEVTCPNFWKRVITYTLLMAVVGHLIENAYTGIGILTGGFGVSDPNFVDIWLRPLKPMWVYSVCTVFFFFIVIPLKEQIHKRVRSKALNIGAIFLISFVIAFLTELVMGLLLNQPDANGVYPLWDFTGYSLTVLNQAYLVNDFWYAVLITVCAFFIIPLIERRATKLGPHVQTFIMVCSVVFVGTLFVWYWPTYFEPWISQALSFA